MSDETKRREEVRRSLISNHRCLGRKVTVYSEALRVIDALARECEELIQNIRCRQSEKERLNQRNEDAVAERDALKARVEDLELDKEHLQKQNLRCVAEAGRAEAKVNQSRDAVDAAEFFGCMTGDCPHDDERLCAEPLRLELQELCNRVRAAMADAAPTEEPNDGE